MRKLINLCWKRFVKGDYWIFFGSSLMLGLPFIENSSVIFQIPFIVGNLDFKQALLLSIAWLFVLLVSELINIKINNKFYYNYINVFWGIIGFSIALLIIK